jgi:flavin-dependent dehydrogenase
VRTLEVGDADTPARLRVRQGERTKTFEAQFVIDASGHSAFGARATGLLPSHAKGDDESSSKHGVHLASSNVYSSKHAQCNLRTHTRATYGHFEFDLHTNNLDEACGGASNAFRYRRDAGTMHHVFDGGWIWVIPFDNGTVSVGLVLNTFKYPYDASVDKDEEFWSFINRFPTVKAHLGGLKMKRQLLRRGRIQVCVRRFSCDGDLLRRRSCVPTA